METLSDSDDVFDDTPPELKSAANAAVATLLPSKSAERYEKYYRMFSDYLVQNNTSADQASENRCLAFFTAMAEKYQPTTLWSMYSCISKKLLIEHSISTKSWEKMKAFLKKLEESHLKKKAATFTREEIHSYLDSAADDEEKLALIIGLCGALRTDELSKLEFDDVCEESDQLQITIRSSKTGKFGQF